MISFRLTALIFNHSTSQLYLVCILYIQTYHTFFFCCYENLIFFLSADRIKNIHQALYLFFLSFYFSDARIWINQIWASFTIISPIMFWDFVWIFWRVLAFSITLRTEDICFSIIFIYRIKMLLHCIFQLLFLVLEHFLCCLIILSISIVTLPTFLQKLHNQTA